MADEHIRLGCGISTVLIADPLAEQQLLVLTANQDTPYMSGVLDLRNGPMVMEVPPGLLGTLNNIWQQPLCDLGGPFSPEQNRGGRFLILPPGYEGKMPEFHYHVVASDTNIVVFYLRGILQTRADLPELVEHTYKIRLPKDVPAAWFWSLTAYDNETRSMIQNDLGRPLIGSVHGAKPNEDGSYEAYFGPELPTGIPEENWVQTKPGMGWFVYLLFWNTSIITSDGLLIISRKWASWTTPW
jgi:hypothetical protein